jgi:hypothetical protein
MNRIKFSHKYEKLGAAIDPKLLEVITLGGLFELSQQFIDYDTDEKYQLPCRGKLLMLIFDKGTSPVKNLFITIRRWTPEKEKYYRSKIGEHFVVIVNE